MRGSGLRTVAGVMQVALAGAAALVLSACASHPQETAAPQVPYDRDASIASFEQVWTTVRDKHWDPTLGGLDWNKVHDELRPRIEAATSMAAARRVMDEMLDRLGQSHFGIWPQEIYTGQSTPEVASTSGDATHGTAHEPTNVEHTHDTPGEGYAGIEVRAIGNDAVITRVAPGSPGEAAGVRPGWIIAETRGEKVSDLLARVDKEGPEHASKDLKLNVIFQHLFAGDEGEKIDATFVDGAESRQMRTITLARAAGTPATLGNLPTFYLEIDRARLPENIEYFRFNIFMDPPRLMGEFQKSAEAARDARGFIIDLRGNPGGIGGLALGIGGWFITDSDAKLGTMYTRSGSFNFILNPRLRAYRGPLAILVDRLSGSTSEILAGGMKDIGRARIFGQRSAGAALPSLFDKLPNGDRFQYAMANYISAGGKPLEGNGVEPDEVVAPDRGALLAGRDPVIDAATRWITSQPATNAGSGGTP